MATVKNVLEKAYTKVNGEYSAMVENSDDANTYLSVLNQVICNWFSTPYTKWQSTFNPSYDLTEIVESNKFEYNIADNGTFHIANSPFDSVYFVNGDVILKKYKMTDQALFQASTAPDICAVFGDTLYLKTLPDEIIGSTIRVPVYIQPSPYTSFNQSVKFDSIPWLVASMAAFICDSSPVPFIARNADKFYKEADIYMKSMRANNKHRQHLTIKKASQTIDDQNFGSLSQAINAGVGAGGGSFADVDGGTF